MALTDSSGIICTQSSSSWSNDWKREVKKIPQEKFRKNHVMEKKIAILECFVIEVFCNRFSRGL